MVVQLPDGALATAVGVQIYSYLCLLCSVLMIALVCKHREKDSYIALLAYAAFLSTTASIVQQVRTIVLWDDIKTEQFYYVQNHVGQPELALAGPSYGPDLVLFYIQYYCYVVESILTLVWAFALAFSVFSPKENRHHQRARRKYSIAAKCVAALLPGFIVGLLQIPAVQCSVPLFITIADFSWAASLTLGAALLVAILAKYIQTRRKVHRWSARYRQQRQQRSQNQNQSHQRHRPQGSTVSAGSSSGGARVESEGSGIYDKWLIIRFTVALLFIEVFQILTIFSEITKLYSSQLENLPPEPDTSAERARGDFTQFLPGVSIGLLVFLVFGTTKTCRHTIWTWVMPPRFRRRTLLTIGAHHHGLSSPSQLQSPPSSPNLYRRPSTFITSPLSLAPAPSLREATQQYQQQQQLPGGFVTPYVRSLYPLVCEPARAHIPRSRVAEIIACRREEPGMDSCSLDSAEAGKSGSLRDREGSGPPYARSQTMPQG